jgi:hypothetical protein
VLSDLQEITKQVAAQAALDRLWLQLKIPAVVPNSKKRRCRKSPLPWSSPASASSLYNEFYDGLNQNVPFRACQSPPPFAFHTPSPSGSSSDFEQNLE